MGIRLISWNIARRGEPWQALAADQTLDVALLQEATPPPEGVAVSVAPERSASWVTAGSRVAYRTAIAAFSDRVTVTPIPTRSFADSGDQELAVSREGTVTAAELALKNGEVVTVASVYGYWEKSKGGTEIFGDASVHRILSDLAPLVTGSSRDRLIVAGDLNIYRGYGDRGSEYWKGRYDSVFTRFEAMGLPFVGPQHPNGRLADPRPAELPSDSKNVPTYHTNKATPATAQHQLDFVFASPALHRRLTVKALNEVDQWLHSDHCRVEIELAEG